MSKKDDDINDLLTALMPTLVWRISSVEDEPKITIRNWDVKKDIAGNCYFVGTRGQDSWGRVSTPVVEFDAEQQCGRTRSGRIYQLLGPPGLSEKAELVWSLYIAANGITEADK